jgi:hypothetical protein
MITAKVCNPSEEQPFESFVDKATTTHYVCLPEGVDYKLFFQVNEPGQLTIEADGEEIFACAVEPSQHFIDLKKVLTTPPPARSIFASLRGTSSGRARRIRQFKVIVRSGTGESSTVVATFDFHLMAPVEYKQAYLAHLETCPTCPKPVYPHRFVVDWAADDRKHCWNCRETLSDHATQCPRCGSDQDRD